MKRKTRRRGNTNREFKGQRKHCGVTVKGSLAEHLTVPMERFSFGLPVESDNYSRFQMLLDAEANPSSVKMDFEDNIAYADDKGFILSQDFFW